MPLMVIIFGNQIVHLIRLEVKWEVDQHLLELPERMENQV